MTAVTFGAPRATLLAHAGTGLALGLILAGAALNRFGATWDVSWHRVIGRDTFWSPPHVALYAGVILTGLAALYATVTAMGGRPTRGRELRLGPLRAELGIALVGIGAFGIVASGPLDELWHRTYGRDIDIWSPPHLVAVGFGALASIGLATALAPGVFSIPGGVRRLLRALALGNLIGVFVFALNFYGLAAVTRDAFLYPLLAATLVPFALALAATFLGGRWPATLAALWFTGLALANYAVLDWSGWRPPAFPPLVVVGAGLVDTLRARGGRLAEPLALGVAFVGGFLAAELARMVLLPPEGTLSAGALRELRAPIEMQYYLAAQARPWLSGWPAAAFVVGAPIAALSWLLGRRLGAALDSTDDEGP